ncbi:MAG: hypothetical protein ACMVY4_20560 [Minwuia sp.]|uniref:hypothetical protein n=1 Tax=Minwuia sp. TaxID=2493630 RepID=UPI003A83E762
MLRKAALAAVVVSMGLTAAIGAQAQDRKYRAWQDDQGRFQEYPEHTQRMLDELEELLAAGRRDRAASPAYLDDFEAILKRHEQAERRADRQQAKEAYRERRPAVSDDFADGNFTENPAWQVIQGEYFVARGNRLFAFVAPQEEVSADNNAEKIVQLFGAILQANRQDQDDENTRRNSRAINEPAAILLPQEITNAFDLKTTLMSDDETGGIFELGVYQGRDARNGYRLQFTADKARLIVVGRSVTTIAETNFSFPASQGRRPGTYDVRWLREKNGRMQVFVDGNRILNVANNGFQDDFDGFRLVNAEGRHGMDSIEITMLD